MARDTAGKLILCHVSGCGARATLFYRDTQKYWCGDCWQKLLQIEYMQ